MVQNLTGQTVGLGLCSAQLTVSILTPIINAWPHSKFEPTFIFKFKPPFSHILVTKTLTSPSSDQNPSIMISDLIYPELKTTDKIKFAGENFIIWKLKIDFVLADNKVDYVLTDPIPIGDQNQWLSDDSTCCQLIIDTVEDQFHTLILPAYKPPTAKSIMETINKFCNFCSMNKT